MYLSFPSLLSSVPEVKRLPKHLRKRLWMKFVLSTKPPSRLARRVHLYSRLFICGLGGFIGGLVILGDKAAFLSAMAGIYFGLWLYHVWWINALYPAFLAYVQEHRLEIVD
jgi:hypothetical protein